MSKRAVAVADDKEPKLDPRVVEKSRKGSEECCRLRRETHINILRFGKSLFEFGHSQGWANLGYATWKEWCDRELHLEHTTAARYARIYERCCHLPQINLDEVASVNPQTLYAVRKKLTVKSAGPIMRDMQKVFDNSMSREDFLEKWGEPKEPGGPPKGQEARGPDDKYERPASARSKVDEALDWCVAFTPAMIEDFIQKLAERLGRTHGFTHQAAVRLVANMPTQEVSQFMVSFVQHDRFKGSQKALGNMLGVLAGYLDEQGVLTLNENLHTVMAGLQKKKGGARKG